MLVSIPNNEINFDDMDKEYSIDMSNTSFGLEKEKLAAFIYIRNCGIKSKLDFSNCNYIDKEEYLLTFMQNSIEVKCDDIYDTWVSILCDELKDNSILNKEEIEKFKERNEDYLILIKTFINSLILFKIKDMDDGFFHTDAEQDFYHTEYDKISIVNICDILTQNSYIFMKVIGEYPMIYFDKLFNGKDSWFLMNFINNMTMFNELFSVVFNSILDNREKVKEC